MSLRSLSQFFMLWLSLSCEGMEASSISDLALVQTRAHLAREESDDNLDGSAETTAILVLASTHGAGTSMFSDALGKHPCVIDVGEPFGGTELLFGLPSELRGSQTALFGNHLKPNPHAKFHKLASNIERAVRTEVHLDHDLLAKSRSVYSFFEAVREASCANYNLTSSCRGRCIFGHKLFPDYISDHFQVVENYLTKPRVGVIHLMRNEADVAASNARRFGPYPDWKLERDLEWHKFLSSLGRSQPKENFWQEVHSEDIFRSSRHYIAQLEKVFRDMQLGDAELLAPLRAHVEEEFRTYEEQGHVSR